jgi:hypothetical protein
MKGLRLAEEYYSVYGSPMILNKFSRHAERIAAGFVGPGSEDYVQLGTQLQAEYAGLPQSYKGFGPRVVSPGEEARTDVSEIAAFYKRYTGFNRVPESIRDWMFIPEHARMERFSAIPSEHLPVGD